MTYLVNFRTDKKILRSSLYRENRHDEFGAYEVMEFMFGWTASFLASNSASSTQKRGIEGHNGLKKDLMLHSYFYPSTISRDIGKEFKLQVYEFTRIVSWNRTWIKILIWHQKEFDPSMLGDADTALFNPLRGGASLGEKQKLSQLTP